MVGASRTLPIPIRRTVSFLMAWLLISVSFPSHSPIPLLCQSCLLGITTGSVGTSEDQSIPHVLPTPDKPTWNLLGVHPGIHPCSSPGSLGINIWCLSGVSRLWLPAIEVILECLTGIVVFIRLWLWGRRISRQIYQLGILSSIRMVDTSGTEGCHMAQMGPVRALWGQGTRIWIYRNVDSSLEHLCWIFLSFNGTSLLKPTKCLPVMVIMNKNEC